MSAITLLSDLGTKDAAVSIAKAILWRYAPDAPVVDISHHAAQYDLQQAAYLLLSAYRYFPAGTVHVLLTDVFSSAAPRILLAEKEGHFFIAPDNGILVLAFNAEIGNVRACKEFKPPYLFSEWINDAGKIIEKLWAGDEIGLHFPLCEIKQTHRLLQPQPGPHGVDCNIMYIDRYENVVLDITRAQFEEIVKNRPFRIKIMRAEDITRISDNYNDVNPGEPLCRFNNAGFLEIAFNHAPAASFLGLNSFSSGNLRYQTIRIFF
jgi:S-adenosylmethionine hydrolase